MTGLEIILFILGAAFVIISFFIVDNGKGNEGGQALAELAPETIDEMKAKLEVIAADTAESVIHDTDEKLDKLSNDKIIAVGEFSDQVMEKITANHQEVVFLYQMLKDKEEELKVSLQTIDKSRIELEKIVRDGLTASDADKADIQIQAAEINNAIKVNSTAVFERSEASIVTDTAGKTGTVQNESAIETQVKDNQSKTGQSKEMQGKTGQKKAPAQRKTKKTETTDKKSVIGVAPEKLDAGITNRNNEILALYKRKKSVVEISKLLGMGQGEVKLIIDLYGK